MFRSKLLATLSALCLLGASALGAAVPASAEEAPTDVVEVVQAPAAEAPVAVVEEPAPPVEEVAPPVEVPVEPVPEPAPVDVPATEPVVEEPTEEAPAAEVPTVAPEASEEAEPVPDAAAKTAAASIVVVPQLAADPVKKVTFCHATASETNPYNLIETSVNAFFQAGHDTHQNFEDIVPPFTYEKQGETIDFPGLNWDAEGQAIFNAGCSTPDDDPLVATAVVTFTAATCEDPELLVLGAISNATWGEVTDPDGPLDYSVTATADDGAEFAGGLGELLFEGELDPIDTSEECDNTTVKKIEFCHATGSESNPYNLIETSVNAFFQAGHDTHQNFEDIVPPFSYIKFGEQVDFPGLNWDAEGQAIFNAGCTTPDDEPLVATATVSFTDPTCESPEGLVLGDIVNATWGPITNPDGPLSYSVTATADDDAEFAGGLGEITFSGELEGPLPPDSPECDLPDLSAVLPAVSFTQFTCSGGGTITLGVAEGYNPEFVTFTVNGESGIEAGTYPAAAGLATVTAQAVDPHTLEPEWSNPEPFLFSVPTVADCTPPQPPAISSASPSAGLAMTGSAVTLEALLAGAGLLAIGAAALLIRRHPTSAE